MDLEDQLKSANLRAEEKIKNKFLVKEEALKKANKEILAEEKKQITCRIK